jgi:hypothetical protein
MNQEPIGGAGQSEYNPVFDLAPRRRIADRPTARSGRVLGAFEIVEQRRRPQI